MGLPGEALALSLKYVPSVALSHFHPVHSSYKEADLTASGKRRKQLSLPSAKDFFSSAFTSSPAPKSLPRSDHGNKAYPGDYSRLVLDREKSKQGLRPHSAGSISWAGSRAGTANYARERSSSWAGHIQEKKCRAAILYSGSKERQLGVQPGHEQFDFRCLFFIRPLECVLGTRRSRAHSLAPGCYRGRDADRCMSWHLRLPFSTSALLFTGKKSRVGTSPGPGRTCTKWGKCSDRSRIFLITESGGFPGDLLPSNTDW